MSTSILHAEGASLPSAEHTPNDSDIGPIRRQARTAGFLYLVMGLIAPIGLMVVPGRLIVRGDAAATAELVRASAWLLRVGIASELIHQALAIFVALALERLFRRVDAQLARLVVILGALVSVPIAFMNVVNEIAALALARGVPFLAPFEPAQRDALAYLFLHLHGRGLEVAAIFWGLWLFPFGRLVMRSGFIPPVLGVLMMIAGVGYLVDSFTSLLLPSLAAVVGQFTMIAMLGELPIVFWLVIWGARRQRPRGTRTT